MKKIILTIFLFVCSVSFGELKDNIGLFSEEEAVTVNEAIEKLEKEKEIKIYLNTVIGEESFQIENPQKTFIITYQKIGKNVVVTELKFTEDLRMGDKSQEIDLILDALKEQLFEKNYVGYTTALLEQVGNFITLEQKEDDEEQTFPEDSAGTKKGFLRRIFSKNP
jgi:hypothetical protein